MAKDTEDRMVLAHKLGVLLFEGQDENIIPVVPMTPQELAELVYATDDERAAFVAGYQGAKNRKE